MWQWAAVWREYRRKQRKAAKGQQRCNSCLQRGKTRAAKCTETAMTYTYSIDIAVDFAGLVSNVNGAGEPLGRAQAEQRAVYTREHSGLLKKLQLKDGRLRPDCHRAERIIILNGQGSYMDAVNCRIE